MKHKKPIEKLTDKETDNEVDAGRLALCTQCSRGTWVEDIPKDRHCPYCHGVLYVSTWDYSGMTPERASEGTRVEPGPESEVQRGMLAGRLPPGATPFTEALYTARKLAGLSQAELAEKLNCCAGTISNLERGRTTRIGLHMWHALGKFASESAQGDELMRVLRRSYVSPHGKPGLMSDQEMIPVTMPLKVSSFAEVLHTFRKQAGLTQTQLAERLLCHRNTIQRIESGKTFRIKQETHRRLAFLAQGIAPELARQLGRK